MAFKPGQDRFFHCTVFFSFMAVPKIGDTPNVTLDSDSPIPIYPKIGQNRFFYCMEVSKTGNVLFLKHHISVPPHLIPRPSFTLKPTTKRFL